jgi:hypothetical protein
MLKGFGLVVAALLVTTPAMATTSLMGSIHAAASARLGEASYEISNSDDIDAPISVTSTRTADPFLTNDVDSVEAFNTVSATWTSAEAGFFIIAWGWAFDAEGFDGPVEARTNIANYNWRYTFTASGNGTFSGTYMVLGSGNTFGLQPLSTGDDWTSGQLGGDVSDPTANGSFSVPIVNGQTYSMSIANNGNLSNDTDGFAAEGSAEAIFNWQITYNVVPEPGGWALLLTGFGLTGAMMRRRQAMPVIASR